MLFEICYDACLVPELGFSKPKAQKNQEVTYVSREATAASRSELRISDIYNASLLFFFFSGKTGADLEFRGAPGVFNKISNILPPFVGKF